MNFQRLRHARVTLGRGKRASVRTEPGKAVLGVIERAPAGEGELYEL